MEISAGSICSGLQNHRTIGSRDISHNAGSAARATIAGKPAGTAVAAIGMIGIAIRAGSAISTAAGIAAVAAHQREDAAVGDVDISQRSHAAARHAAAIATRAAVTVSAIGEGAGRSISAVDAGAVASLQHQRLRKRERVADASAV